MSQIAELLKDMRNAGLSQTEIAKMTGIPQPRISRWEAGEVAAAADDALRVAEVHLRFFQSKLAQVTTDTAKAA